MRYGVLLVPALLAAGACTDSEQSTEPTAPAAAPAEAAVTANATWQPRTDYPTDLYLATSASYTNPSTLKSTLYVIGGATKPGGPAGSLTDAVRAYNVSTNAWSTKAKLPIRLRDANQVVELNGKIYVSGGFSRYWDAARGVWRLSTSKALYVYDVATNAWTRKADMPATSVHGVAAAYNGLIYVAVQCFDEALCGDFDHGAVWRYNPGTDRWVLESRVPHGETWHAGGGIIGGKLYVADDYGALDVYDLTTKVWTTGPQRPYRACSPASTTFQAKLYLVNCANDDGSDEAMLVFDPKTSTWTPLAPAPRGSFATLSRVDVNGVNRLELVGGAKAGSNWQYVP
ncbi:MAG: Kelch repeat-containing protein [Gemmatimonadales bacterium]